MPETMIYTGTLAIEECCECHITFAMPADLQRRCREADLTFYCPLGHGQHYATTEVQQLKRQLAREERWRKDAETAERAARDQAQAAERSRAAYKGQLTRVKNRVANGTCPCCHRHFQQLQRHMTSKHPGFTDDPDA
jgi:hypothetical protein